MKLNLFPGNARWRSLLFLGSAAFFLSSCAGVPTLQPEISALLAANRPVQAADRIETAAVDYGQGNYLLYYLDRGLVEFYAGRYKESVASFEKAKQRFRELYTESLSKEALSWAVNDYMLPYRGADHEYVLVNIFQALNFIALGDVNEALVEARDLDAKYQAVGELAGKVKRDHFEDNGFARLFMGLVSGASVRREDQIDANLWFKESLGLYRSYYGGRYVPPLLEENIHLLKADVSPQETPPAGSVLEGRPGQAQLVVIQLVGFSPVKLAEVVAIPLEGEIVAKMSLPVFARRDYLIRSGRLIVEGRGGRVSAQTELGDDIEDLAIRDLESRKALVMAKAALRPAMKYLVERNQKEAIEKKHGGLAGDLFSLASSLYNIYSEQADLRSWQALPAQIRVARLFLDPGEVRVSFEDLAADGAVLAEQEVGALQLTPGETRFIIVRSGR